MVIEIEQEVEVIPGAATLDHLYNSSELCQLLQVTPNALYKRLARARKESETPIVLQTNPTNRRERLWTLEQVGKVMPNTARRGRKAILQ